MAADPYGNPWWTEVSKDAFANGIADAVSAYWRWQKSRKQSSQRVGFPRFGARAATPTGTGSRQGLSRRRRVKLPRLVPVRTHQNIRRLERLLGLGRAKLLNETVRRRGRRLLAVFQVDLVRSQCNVAPTEPGSVVGVDTGARRLATVANRGGEMTERVAGPRALDRSLTRLRRLYRARARCRLGPVRYRRRTNAISALSVRISNRRLGVIHRLTTGLAKTHGTVVVESPSVSGMLRQIHLWDSPRP